MASTYSILRPIVLTKVISRQMSADKWILNFMGMAPGGKNEANFGHGREGSYQVFNNTRLIGRGRAPGTAAARSLPQSVSDVAIVYPRMHDSVSLLAERLHNLSRIGDPRARDIAGNDMIRRQTAHVAQKAANWRAAMVIGMLRDELYVTTQGDDWDFNFTSTGSLFRINFQMPDANKTQLNMLAGGNLIDKSWADPSADIPNHLGNINAAFQQLYGGRLQFVLINSSGWQNVINNDNIASQAGLAAPSFRRFESVVGTREDGSQINVQAGELTSVPGVTFYITDEGLDVGRSGSESFSKYIPDNFAIFMPSPDTPNVFSLQTGSEPIAEYDGGPETVRTGLSTWSTKTSNPTNTNIFVLDNALAINHIPVSVAYGTVVF